MAQYQIYLPYIKPSLAGCDSNEDCISTEV